eukprot:2019210-Amphidinium_carterae.1
MLDSRNGAVFGSSLHRSLLPNSPICAASPQEQHGITSSMELGVAPLRGFPVAQLSFKLQSM